MATQGIQGLFGGMGTPDEMQRQMTEQKAMQFATMSPQQQLSYNIYKNTGNLGRGLAGAMGVDVQDPAIKRATMLRQLASQYDTNTPEGLRQMAAALQGTDPELGFQVMQRAQALELAQAKLGSEQALTAQRNREKAAADPFQKLLEGAKYTPASIAEFQRTGKPEDLVPTEKPGGRPEIKKIGIAKGTEEAVYTYQTGNDEPIQVTFKNVNGKQQMIPYNGAVDQTTAKTQVSVDAKGETAFVQELGKLDAKAVSDAYKARGVAIEQLGTLKKMAEVADRPIITGSLAEQRTDLSNFFNSIGLASNKDQLKTANSQEYIKYSTGLVLDNLKKTGYNPSNADMKVVQSIIPRLETDPKARKELIKFMSERANDVINETTSMDVYARKNRGLSGYVPTIPQVNFNAPPTSNSPYAGMSDEALAARIRVLKAQQP
jgi:hypothetical protein